MSKFTYVLQAEFPYNKNKMVVWKPLQHARKIAGFEARETLIQISFEFEMFHILATQPCHLWQNEENNVI